MRELSAKEIQDKLLETVSYIDLFCKKRNIEYYMIGGTLLGAVRHGGFIPWDDDIDIAMMRDQYDRFIEEWGKESHEGYFLQNTDSDKTSRHTISRVLISGTQILHDGSYNVSKKHQELFVDIFPLDNVPDNKTSSDQQKSDLLKLKNTLGCKFSNRASTRLKHMVKVVRQWVMAPITYHFVISKFNKVAQRYNGVKTKNVCSMSSQYDYYKQSMPVEYYGKPIRMKFEDKEFLSPAMPDAYLKQLYGDYMKLPPKEKQVFNIKVQEL